MRLSENFTLQEFTFSSVALQRNIPNNPSPPEIDRMKLLCETILQPIRNKWKRPILITSGFRSISLNKAVGGVASSQHVKGEAVDIVTEDNIGLWTLINLMLTNGEIEVGQLINEKNYSWIHISLATSKYKNVILHL